MSSNILRAALLKLLPPLVRVLLRNGMAAKTFHELVKSTYVAVARDEFGLNGRKANISRIAILTGLTRKEVQSLIDAPRDREDPYADEYNRAARVMTGWLRDPDFGDGNGHPLPLRLLGKRLSFSELVKRYSGDIPVRPMLDELVRVGAVKQLKDGRLGLVVRGYIPQKGLDQKLAILGHDTADLITTIDHNLYVNPASPRIQRKVMYDNVPVESAEAFRLVAQARAQEMLEALDRWLSLGVYHFEERIDEGV